MPYSSVKDVPDYVLEAHRKQWLEVFNSAYAAAKKDGKSDKDAEASAFAQANGVVKKQNSDLTPDTRNPEPRFVVLLAAPPATGLVRIPLAVTGTWKRADTEFSITREDLDALSANFAKRKNGEINVDYDHASEMPEVAAGGPIPSAGRVLKLDTPEAFNGTGQEILYGWFEPTDRARELLKNREYRYISPAIDWGARDKQTGKRQGTTLTSVALTNRPFLEELPQIHLSDPAYRPIEESRQLAVGSQKCIDVGDVHVDSSLPNFSIQPKQPVEGAKHDSKAQGTDKEKKVMTYKIKKVAAGEHAGKIGCYDEGGNMVALAEVEPDADDQKVKAGEEQFAQFLTDIGLGGNSPEQLKEMLAAGERAQKRDQAESSRKALLTEVIVGGCLDTFKAGEFLAKGKLSNADFKAGLDAEKRVDGAIQAGKLLPRNRGEGIRFCLAEPGLFKSLIEEGKPVLNLKPRGATEGAITGDSSKDLTALAHAREMEKKISFAQALSDVSHEHPDLARQHREKVTAGNRD